LIRRWEVPMLRGALSSTIIMRMALASGIAACLRAGFYFCQFEM
jgi:hypothetical protein